jgi:Zn ribbon nucleic-acid-binding protein
MTDTKAAACPQCGDTESLATIERLVGSCRTLFEFDEQGRLVVEPQGETVISWDTSESVALECVGCGWELQTPSVKAWREALKPSPAEPEADPVKPRFNGVEIIAQLPQGSEWVMVGKWQSADDPDFYQYVVFDAWDLNATHWGQGRYFMQDRERAIRYAFDRAGYVRAGQLAEV